MKLSNQLQRQFLRQKPLAFLAVKWMTVQAT
jgi:hypothetical protein